MSSRDIADDGGFHFDRHNWINAGCTGVGVRGEQRGVAGQREPQAACVEVFNPVSSIELCGDVGWRGSGLWRWAKQEHRQVNKVGQCVRGRAVHHPAAVSFESAGPVVPAKVALAARPATNHRGSQRPAEFACEQSLFQCDDSGLVDVLKADEDWPVRRSRAAIMASTSSTQPAAGFSHITAFPEASAASV